MFLIISISIDFFSLSNTIEYHKVLDYSLLFFFNRQRCELPIALNHIF